MRPTHLYQFELRIHMKFADVEWHLGFPGLQI